MQIHHTAITVNNLDESIDFYSRLFGLKPVRVFERPDMHAKAVFLQGDNVQLELWEFANGYKKTVQPKLEETGIRHIAFETDSIEDFLKGLPESILVTKAKKGASGGTYAFLKDPSGIDIEIYEPN